jgi:hypothetical protein
MTPEDLYNSYSKNPCETLFLEDPLRGKLFDSVAKGTPLHMKRVVQFLKHVKYPCINNVPKYNEIRETGKNRLGLNFKFLQQLDVECFTEIQPSIRSGTSHTIRNASDITRACFLTANGNQNQWYHRSSPEYLERFGENSLPDCLMVLGPDLVPEAVAQAGRAPSTDIATPTYSGMLCLPGDSYGVAGAPRSCLTPPASQTSQCRSCGFCPPPEERFNQDDPCCAPGTLRYYNECCKAPLTSRLDFSYSVPAGSDGSSDFRLKHVGILERNIYGGYANLLDNSGNNFNAIMDDIFLDYFQGINDWNYTNNTIKNPLPSTLIPRMRTISILLDATVNQGRSPVTNSQNMANSIKDLLWNGYGVILLSNIGFPNIRDSQGLAYPDRIWYTTYTIIGYDDTKLEFDECVYVLSCPWGNWITGGNPSWGPLPPGCFLVTETHLKCMLNYYPDNDFYGCRNQLPCNPALNNCEDPATIISLQGCGSHGPRDKCEPYYCSKQQRSTGLVFALSMTDNFGPQVLRHQDFYPISKIKELIEEKTLYYQNR